MRLIFSALLFVALVSVSFGQTPPTTDCGKAAQACYDKSKTDIDNKLISYDFNGACSSLSSVLTCIKAINCPAAGTGERDNVHQNAVDDQGGICDANGMATGCGDQVKTCIDEMNTILSLFKSTNATKACPVIVQFDKCAQKTEVSSACRPKIDKILDKLKKTFMEDSLVEGCDGDCGKRVGDCMKNMDAFTAGNFKEAELGKYCSSVNTAIACIRGLPQTEDSCKGQQAGATLVSNVISSQQNAISDLCNPDGTITRCVTGLTICLEDFKTIDRNANVKIQCQTASKYLECLSTLPCENALRPTIDQTNRNFQTDEVQMNCPIVGSCTSRLDTCEGTTKRLKGMDPKSQKSKYCGLIKQSENCFDAIRKDPVCIRENIGTTYVESKIKQENKGYCGGGGATLAIDVKPSDVTEGTTSSLVVNCSYPYDSSSGITNLISLTISVGEKNDPHTFTELARSSIFSPATASLLQPVNASAKAHMDANGMSFLSVTWAYPTAREAGRYRCVAHGIGMFGHPQEAFAEITARKQEFSTTEIMAALTIAVQRIEALEGKVSKCESTFESLASLDSFVKSTQYNGSVYYLSKSRYGDATQAGALCILQGGYLVEISDLAEHEFIAGFLNNSVKASFTHVLTGGTDRDQEGNWKWRHSDQPLTNNSALWAPGAPVAVAASNHRCALLHRDNDWLLENLVCFWQPGYAYLCEVAQVGRY